MKAEQSMNKLAIFVDVQNVYYTVKEAHGCHFDYTEFERGFDVMISGESGKVILDWSNV